MTQPGEITGYSVALPGDTAADGRGGRRPVWYGGGKLASDLALPRIRQRWAGLPGSRPGSLTGISMTAGAARTVLIREALRAARSASRENEFFTLLERSGLQVRLRSDPPSGSAGTSSAAGSCSAGSPPLESPGAPPLPRFRRHWGPATKPRRGPASGAPWRPTPRGPRVRSRCHPPRPKRAITRLRTLSPTHIAANAATGGTAAVARDCRSCAAT